MLENWVSSATGSCCCAEHKWCVHNSKAHAVVWYTQIMSSATGTHCCVEHKWFVLSNSHMLLHRTHNWCVLSSSILMQSTHNRCVVSNRHMLFHSTHNCVSLSSRSSSSTCCWVVHTNEYLHYYPEYAVRALDSWHRQHGLLFPKTFHLWDSPSLPFKGYQGSSPEIKKPGHEFNHSPLSNARVKNERSDTTSPLPPLLSCCGQDFFFKLFFTSSWL